MVKSDYTFNQAQDFFYYSSSMIPTFEPGDILKVRPNTEHPVDVGDIIVFFSAERQKMITHRAVAVKACGIITCGDNPSNKRDPWTLSLSDVVGTVTGYERSGRYFTVLNGKMGLFRFYGLRVRAFFIEILWFWLRPVYRLLSGYMPLKFILPDNYKPRVINLKNKNDMKFILLMGKKVVGWKKSSASEWQIKFPYRLFVGNL